MSLLSAAGTHHLTFSAYVGPLSVTAWGPFSDKSVTCCLYRHLDWGDLGTTPSPAPTPVGQRRRGPRKKKSFWVGVLLSGPVIIFRGPCNDDECCCSMHAKEICRKRKRGGAEGFAAFWSKRFSSIFWAEVDVINYRQHIVKISCKVLSPSNAFPVAPTFLELVWASCRRLGRLDAELTMDVARSGSAFRTALCYSVITAVDI